jgi:hypothetical protein
LALPEFHQHALGAGGNQGSRRADQQLAAPNGRTRHVSNFGGTGLKALQDLLHVLGFCVEAVDT